MRLAFLGTPDAATTPLRALVDGGHDIALVVSAADKRRGRGASLMASPVKATALELGLPVTARIDDVIELDPAAELGVVVAFGRLIKPHVLAALPMLNLHFSLLPRWRGAAPVERAILAGDEETGVAVMGVEEGLDTGPIYAESRLAIGADETADELRARLVEAGTTLLLETLAGPLPEPRAQLGEAEYAHKIDPAELHVDWSKPAVDIHRLIRIGGAWTTHDGRRLKLWRSTLDPAPAGLTVPGGDGPVTLLEVQPEGKGRMSATAWANGAHVGSGHLLGT